jgi:peptidoglycan-N-acetylglucosamine deacetylase
MIMIQKIAYLTIDDAPVVDMKEKIDFLDSTEIKAIWFCQGNKLEKFPDQAIFAIKNGHIIGNHSYNHPNFSEINLDEAKNQIEKTDKIIEDLYWQADTPRPIKTFRFPGLNNGSKDEYEKTDWNNEHVRAIQKILSEFGYKQPKFENINYMWFKKAGFDKCINIDCSYDSFDYCLEEGEELFDYHDLPTILARIDEDVPEGGRGLNYPNSNEIIMMHAWIPIDAFKALIDKILDKKIEFKLPA